MEDWLERTRLLWGDRALDRLARARVAVLGLGGVGSAVGGPWPPVPFPVYCTAHSASAQSSFPRTS